MPTGKVLLPLVCKLVGYHPGRHLEYIKFTVMHELQLLGCYKNNICNSRISKIRILHANPWSLLVLGKIFLYFFGNKLPSWWPYCLHSYFMFFNWLQAKCLQLDSKFTANNLIKQMGLRLFFPYHTIFSLINVLHLGRHRGYIEMLNDARVASLGFFKENVCTTRINKEKKFKIKFQVLLKFAQILPDYLEILAKVRLSQILHLCTQKSVCATNFAN